MNNIKKSIFKTEIFEDIIPELGFCTTWIAQNDGNTKMSLDGSVDFTEELGVKNISTGTSIGTVTSYTIGGTTILTSIPMTFTTKKALFSETDLPTVTDRVLTVITFTIEIICTDATEINVYNHTTAAFEEIGTQFTADYNDCTI